MTASPELQRGRDLYAQRAWGDAHRALAAADAESALASEDLERMGFAAGLSGDDQGMVKVLERAHHAYLQAGNEPRAARMAFWAGYRLIPLGEHGRSQAWLARAQRIVERAGAECVERGYLLLPDAMRALFAGDFAGAQAHAARACEIGERFADADLTAMSRVALGRALLKEGRLAPGLASLDDAMLTATSGELSTSVTGLVYCHVISACSQVYAFDRAREWTAALSVWCETQPQLGGFAGSCLVHRAELFELGGAWNDALDAAQTAERRLSATSDPRATADALYQRAEIHRLRGEDAEAEAAYAQASAAGREPLPGLALLRLAQGRCDTALSATRRIVAATSDRLQRTRHLPAHVEIALAAGQLDEARAARDELNATAHAFDSPVLRAIAAQADAAVALAETRAQAAVEPLRSALLVWQQLGAPYLVARLHVLLGRASHALGDHDGAQLEWTAARAAFTRLGALPDLQALDALSATPDAAAPATATAPSATTPADTHGLSARELEVLRKVASGKTNRAIATELHLSEKTVDRHVSNIFHKLDVPSRAAATAFAYEHGLI